MPRCSKQTNLKGIEIIFEEDSHRYYSKIGGKTIDYVSGTTFIGGFFPTFDPDGSIAERCAVREGVSVEDIRQRWKDKADASCRFGTKIHETMEDVLQGNMLRNKPENTRERLVMETATLLAKRILEKMDVIGIEKIVFDHTIKIAGTMDLYARSKKDRRLWILDYKTNERIETENPWGVYGLPPIQHLPDNNFCHYSLQLNLYENILKRAGYVDPDTPIGKALFHITEIEAKTYPLKDMQADIETMIAYGKS